MPFVRLEPTLSASKTSKPAFTVLRVKDGKSVLSVTLRAHFVRETPFAAGHAFHASFGTDDDAGLLRLDPAPEGEVAFVARAVPGGGLRLRLQDVGALVGREPRPKAATGARFIDGAVLVDLPHVQPKARAVAPATSKVTPPKPPVAVQVGTPAPPDRDLVTITILGVTISRGHNTGSASFGGQTVLLSPRSAHLLTLLARAAPLPVGEVTLIQRLWDKRPAGAETFLSTVVADLGVIRQIGLEVVKVKGVGYRLNGAGA